MNTDTIVHKLRTRSPRSTRDAMLAGVQRAAIRTAGIVLIGGVAGVSWGHAPQVMHLEPVEVAPVIERGPAIQAAR